MKILLIIILPLIGAVQAIPDTILSAAGSLAPTAALTAIAFWLITKTLPEKDKRFAYAIKEIADRQHEDSAEFNKQLHDDSQKLNETLRQMQASCAATQARP